MQLSRLRLLGALFAMALLAAACGSDATPTETAAEADAPAATNEDDSTEAADPATDDDAMDDDAMDEHDADHGDDSDEDHDHGDHDHEGHGSLAEVAEGDPIPGVDVSFAETDDPGMFMMTVTLTNFTITPDNVDGDSVPNEGHMHLLIDGEKLERFYETERMIAVPEGEHLVEVELNTNDHAAWAVDGVAIRAGETLAGSGEAMTDDGHDHDDDHDHSNANAAIEEGLSPDDATVMVTAAFTGGKVDTESDRVEVSLGDIVMVTVASDVDEEVHVHGYDILADVGPDADGVILFTADVPGRFEIEFETSRAFIAEIVVS